MKFERDGIHFSIPRISTISGHSEISIRKGKQILVYEYSVDADFLGECGEHECEGTFKLTEINESDFDFHIPHLSCSKDGTIGEKAVSLLKRSLKDEVINAIRNL